VLNIVPSDPRASIEQQLELALMSRSRLILAFFRQRLVPLPQSELAGEGGEGERGEGGAGGAVKHEKKGTKKATQEGGGGKEGEKTLVRMDEAFPLFFHQIEERLNLRDGYVPSPLY
jgi:hypothetical protein